MPTKRSCRGWIRLSTFALVPGKSDGRPGNSQMESSHTMTVLVPALTSAKTSARRQGLKLPRILAQHTTRGLHTKSGIRAPGSGGGHAGVCPNVGNKKTCHFWLDRAIFSGMNLFRTYLNRRRQGIFFGTIIGVGVGFVCRSTPTYRSRHCCDRRWIVLASRVRQWSSPLSNYGLRRCHMLNAIDKFVHRLQTRREGERRSHDTLRARFDETDVEVSDLHHCRKPRSRKADGASTG